LYDIRRMGVKRIIIFQNKTNKIIITYKFLCSAYNNNLFYISHMISIVFFNNNEHKHKTFFMCDKFLSVILYCENYFNYCTMTYIFSVIFFLLLLDFNCLNKIKASKSFLKNSKSSNSPSKGLPELSGVSGGVGDTFAEAGVVANTLESLRDRALLLRQMLGFEESLDLAGLIWGRILFKTDQK